MEIQPRITRISRMEERYQRAVVSGAPRLFASVA